VTQMLPIPEWAEPLPYQKKLAHLGDDMARIERAADLDRLRAALKLIADFPIPEQDNMIAINMRRIAREALR
jgi:hypothetical protein